jgi:hypothetical protein
MKDIEFQGDIIGVAIKKGDLVICLPKPNRHHHVIQYMVADLGLDIPCTGNQGFYLATGIFLHRDEAMAYVRKYRSKMSPLRNPSIGGNILCSDDLW